MRILSIAGMNIRSLYGSFEIDFSREPLLGSGMFGIVGPTGSGKSSVLDALCLALYGTCPRLQDIRSETRLQELSGNDARTAMSHGATEARAEVTFEVRNHLYRALWRVKRAHGKRQGRIQNATRELVDLTDEKTLASGLKPVEKAIVVVIGLTFEQFSRSVLLAQGQFAAFLQAPADERAKLLETITGLDIYTQLSIKAHEKAREIKDQFRIHQSKLGDLKLPSPDELTGLEQTKTDLIRQLEHMEKEQDTLKKYGLWFEHNSRLEQFLEQALTKHQQAVQHNEQAQNRRLLLERINKVIGLRTELDRAEQGQTNLEQARAVLQDQITKCNELQISCDLLKQDLDHASQQFLQEQDRQQNEKPLLDQARKLDTILEQKAEVVRTQENNWQSASTELKQMEKEKRALEQKIRKLEKSLAQHREWLEQNEKRADLAEQKPLWLDALTKTAHNQSLIRTTRTQLDQVQVDLDFMVRKRDAQEQVAATLEQEAQAVQHSLQTEQDHLDRHQEQYPSEQIEATVELVHDADHLLKALLDRNERQHKLTELLETCRQKISLENEHALASAEQLKQLRLELENVLGQISAKEQTLDRLRTQFEAVDFRKRLESGEPCPVCGSREHPWAHELPPDKNFIDREQDELVLLKKKSQELTHNRTELEKQLVSREETIRNEQKRLAEADTELHVLAAEHTDLYRDLVDRVAQSHLHIMIAEKTLDLKKDRATFETVRTRLLDQKKKAEQARTQQKKLAEALNRLHRQLEEKRLALDAARTARDQSRQDCQKTLKEKETLEGKLHDAQRHWTEFIDRFDPLFGTIVPGWSDQARNDLEQIEQQLVRSVLEYTEKKQRLAEHEQEHQALETARENCARNLDTMTDRVKTLEQEYQQGRAALETIRDQRRQLFEGQAVATIEQQWSRTLADLDRNTSKLRHKEQEQREQLQKLNARREKALEDLDLRKNEAEQAEIFLTQALGKRGLSKKEADELKQYTPEAVEQLDREMTELQTNLETSRRLHLQRQQDLDSFQRDNARPPVTLEELEHTLHQITSQKKDVEEQLKQVQLSHMLLKKQMEQAAELERELDLLKRSSAHWLELNDLIGHHSGQTFRTFAQSLTLKHLVHFANRHLARLAPRFRLVQAQGTGLEVLVLDLDQAGEQRSINSLSGGETFLVSLGLALALAELSSDQTRIQTLFIDEGFGTLDAETLDQALAALEILQAQGKKIGLISHVPALQERLSSLIRITPRGTGRSSLTIEQGTPDLAL
ncbi:AAA family ATPase [bacterium]|nr:AAA family ATPase [bacterium]